MFALITRLTETLTIKLEMPVTWSDNKLSIPKTFFALYRKLPTVKKWTDVTVPGHMSRKFLLSVFSQIYGFQSTIYVVGLSKNILLFLKFVPSKGFISLIFAPLTPFSGLT